MTVSNVFAKLKSVIPFWHRIEEIFFYMVNLVDFKSHRITTEVQEEENDVLTPESIWEEFLNELDALFNQKGIVLSYALSSACAKIAVHYDVYVLEDEDYKEFSYYSVIIERVKKRYLELLDRYFNLDDYDFTVSQLKAKEHLLDELFLTNEQLDDLMEIYDFDIKSVINAV